MPPIDFGGFGIYIYPKGRYPNMKSIKLIILFPVFVVASAFNMEDYTGSFTATIDGKPFEVREDQLFRGLLMEKAASMDGKIPARKVISATFNGPSYDISEDKIFTETIQFEMGYESDKPGTPSYYAAAMQFQSGSYYMVKEESKITITRFEWEADKKHFRISADYDCKMRSWNSSADAKQDVSLKGSMTNIRITVPSWLGTKN